VKITIVYDNQANAGLKSGWGFSCLIETQEKILFDTGDSGEKLIYNMKHLGIRPENVDKVVISHNHFDHTGGLKEFLRLNNKAEVLYPKSFSKPTRISPTVYSTGALGTFIKEQSLVIDTENAGVVVTGLVRSVKNLGIYHVIYCSIV